MNTLPGHVKSYSAGHRSDALMLATLLKFLGALLPMILLVAWLSAFSPNALSRVSRRVATNSSNVVLRPGSSTEAEALAVNGAPLRLLHIDGDDFWVYSLRTVTDLETMAALQNGRATWKHSSNGPTRMTDIAILRFHGSKGVLMAVYLHEGGAEDPPSGP